MNLASSTSLDVWVGSRSQYGFTSRVDVKIISSLINGTIGSVGGSFDYNRRALIDSVGKAAQEVLRSYDKEREANELAEEVRGSVAGRAAQLGVTSWHLSLSHDGGIATAIVVAETA